MQRTVAGPGPINRAPLLVPSEAAAARMDEAIFGELVCGQVTPNVLAVLGAAAQELVDAGAKTIILGNTDMTQAANELRAACCVPLVDSELAHARAAAPKAQGQ